MKVTGIVRDNLQNIQGMYFKNPLNNLTMRNKIRRLVTNLTGVLAYNYSSKSIDYYKLNEKVIDEFACRVAMVGALGVPTIFVSGDDKIKEKAEAIILNMVSAVVKWGHGIERCLSLSRQEAYELIRKAAADACRRIPEIKPYIIEPPYELEIRNSKMTCTVNCLGEVNDKIGMPMGVIVTGTIEIDRVGQFQNIRIQNNWNGQLFFDIDSLFAQ